MGSPCHLDRTTSNSDDLERLSASFTYRNMEALLLGLESDFMENLALLSPDLYQGRLHSVRCTPQDQASIRRG